LNVEVVENRTAVRMYVEYVEAKAALAAIS